MLSALAGHILACAARLARHRGIPCRANMMCKRHASAMRAKVFPFSTTLHSLKSTRPTQRLLNQFLKSLYFAGSTAKCMVRSFKNQHRGSWSLPVVTLISAELVAQQFLVHCATVRERKVCDQQSRDQPCGGSNELKRASVIHQVVVGNIALSSSQKMPVVWQRP